MASTKPPKLTFVPSSSKGKGARTGTIELHYPVGDRRNKIQTPAIVHYTRKGAPVHLTRDNVDRLPIELVSIALEHFLDYNPPTFLEAPLSLTRYIGLRDQETVSEGTLDEHGNSHHNPHIIIEGLRDPSDLRDIISNTEQFIACRSFRGVNKITIDQYLKYTLERPPDVLIALADEPIELNNSQKRTTKSLIRSENYLLKTIKANKATGQEYITNVIAPLVGGTVEAARSEYARTLASYFDGDNREGSHSINDVAGFSINLNTLRHSDTTSLTSQQYNDQLEKVNSLVQASLLQLPTDKFRLAHCPDGPHEILRLISVTGLDLFVDYWSTELSGMGVALDFEFKVPAGTVDAATETKKDLGYNLFDEIYATSFDPLGSKGLQESLAKPGHSAETLGDLPTRAYLHHLLHSHEMTSHVLLAMHNTCVMTLFFASIRKSIEEGTFEQDVRAFNAYYSERLECLVRAQESWTKVNKERGKGRLKGLGQERRDTAEASMEGTPKVEQERMSFKDAKDEVDEKLKDLLVAS